MELPDLEQYLRPPTKYKTHFSLESTLADLQLYEAQLEIYSYSYQACRAFENNPFLPGIVLMYKGELVGMISRQHFFEQLSRPYGRELFLKRPISNLYRFVTVNLMVIPQQVLISQAAQQVLSRPPNLLYEPVVVREQSNSQNAESTGFNNHRPTYKILDVHQLLLAQSQIHTLATELLHSLCEELSVANKELKDLAYIDPLTQVTNRRRFEEYLKQQWQQLLEAKLSLSLIICDVDFFKRFNDTHGHQEGDRCLRSVAEAIQRAARRPADLVARYGGEEFAIILPQTPAAGAIEVAKNIQGAIRSLCLPHAASPVSSYVTLSLGMASLIPTSNMQYETLIEQADCALYQAKQAGRDRFELYKENSNFT
jgi:diguanylate cyclase (GGDEF)-like protein